MAKKKQVKKRAKSRRSSAESRRSSGGSSRSGRNEAKSGPARSSFPRGLGAVVWTERKTGHRVLIAVALLVVLALVGLFVFAPAPKPALNERQQEAQSALLSLQAEMEAKQWAFDEMEAFLGRALPEADSEIEAASQAADRWGQAFSYLKLKTTYVKVPQWLWTFKELLPQSAALYTEAAEDIALLKKAAPEHRPALFAQAKRFLALARGAEAGTYLVIRSAGDVPGPLTERELYPLVADDVLASFPDAPPFASSDEPLPNPSAMAGVPGNQLSRVQTQAASQWSSGVHKVVVDDAVTDTNSAFCDIVVEEKNGHSMPAKAFGAFLGQFRRIADDLARLTPPENGLPEAAGTIRAYRGYEDAVITGRMLASAPELVDPLRLKLFRVTFLSGNLWGWIRGVGQETGIYFVNFPACATGDEFREWLTLTPWDAREELKREIEPAS